MLIIGQIKIRVEREKHAFRRFKGTNVCWVLFNMYLIDPYVYEETLTGQGYLTIFGNELLGLMEVIPLNERQALVW